MLALAFAAASPAWSQGDVAAQATPKAHDVESALRRATTLLIEKQEALDEAVGKGEWPYEGVYRERGEIPIGYRVGGTAIGAWALIESPGYAASPDAQAAVARAVEFILAHLGDERMSSDFSSRYDVRGWGHTYALQLFLRLRSAELVPEGAGAAVDRWVGKLVETLQQTEIVESGGWNYSRGAGAKEPAPASPFMTAPTLLALFEARRQGVEVDQAVVQRALDALEGCRTEAGAIPYTTRGGRDEWPGAIGRSAVTEVVLLLAGRGEVERVRRALDMFLEHWEWLEKRRRATGTHVPPYGIAPYYFFYAHAYAGLAIEFLPEAERAGYRERLLARLFQVQEESGGWNDRVFERSESFGTAMSMLALLAPRLPRSAGWASVRSK